MEFVFYSDKDHVDVSKIAAAFGGGGHLHAAGASKLVELPEFLRRKMTKHWSKVEYLHESVTNPNIIVKGTHSYYSDAWSGSFEEYVVRYLYGDPYSREYWKPQWELDTLYIGDYVYRREAVILMGGNNTHRTD